MPERLHLDVLLAESRRERPWRNGAGSTAEIASFPLAASYEQFHWRVSIATIRANSAFSSFPGVDRTLVPLSSEGLTLVVGSETRPLAQFEMIEFPGEPVVAALDVNGPSKDLNLMVRRGTACASISINSIDGIESLSSDDHEEVLMVVVAGAVVTEGGTPLRVEDALRVHKGQAVTVAGYATVAVVRVRPSTEGLNSVPLKGLEHPIVVRRR